MQKHSTSFSDDEAALRILHTVFGYDSFCGQQQAIILTVIADECTWQEIISRLALENAHVFVSGFHRSNIRYRIIVQKTMFASSFCVLSVPNTTVILGSSIVCRLSRKSRQPLSAIYRPG